MSTGHPSPHLPTILVTETLDPKPARWLSERSNLIWCPHDQTARFDELLPTADALVIRTYTLVTQAMLARAPRLQVIGRAGVGLDNIDVPACRQKNVQVVYTPDANTQAVVEYVIGLMLDVHRPRQAMPDQISESEFHQQRKTLVGLQLDQLTLGIVGFGRIGKRLGQVASAIGMKLLVNDLLSEAELRAKVDYPFEYVDKRTVYSQSDVVTIHVDGRKSNRHLIDASALALLKPHAIFINAARGMLVDHQALADWCRSHQRDGGKAILDVHDPEPPPLSYPLYGLPNAKLLAHLASRTDMALENMSWVVRDVDAVLQGRSPTYPAP